MLEGGIIDRDDRVVLVVTGAGIKDAEASLKNYGSPVKLSSSEEIGALSLFGKRTISPLILLRAYFNSVMSSEDDPF